MTSRKKLLNSAYRVIFVFAIFGSYASQAAAQGEGKAIHLGTRSEVNGAYFRNSQAHLSMRGGDTQEIDEKAVEAISKWLVWPVTWPDNRNNPKNMKKVLKQFENEINYTTRFVKKDNTAYRKMLVKKLTERFSEILKHSVADNRVAAINACYMLPKMGRLQVTEGLDFYIKLAQNPKLHPIVKMAAMRGMQHYPRAIAWTINFGAAEMPLKKRGLARVAVLKDFILHRWNFKTDNHKYDPAAFAYIRLHAIKAMAAIRTPAINVDPLKKKTEGEAVYALVGVLANQIIPAPQIKGKKPNVPVPLFPPPTLKEKIEAAIGLCQMQVVEDKLGVIDRDKYRYEVSVYLIARTVAEMLKAYNVDYPTFVVEKGVRVQSPNNPAILPYKITATRMSQALDTLVDNLTKAQTRQAKYGKVLTDVKKLREKADPLLRQLKTHKRLDNLKATDVRQYLASLIPQNTLLFEGFPESAVILPKQ